jgi:hypothetical protein
MRIEAVVEFECVVCGASFTPETPLDRCCSDWCEEEMYEMLAEDAALEREIERGQFKRRWEVI